MRPMSPAENPQSTPRQETAAMPFIMLTVLIDMVSIGLIIPVLAPLVGTFTGSQTDQAFWYGMVSLAFGVANFFGSPVLGAASDHFGRRPVLLLSTFGLGFAYLVTATTSSLVVLLLSRIVSGATAASFSVANAYVADITPPERRGQSFGVIGDAFGIGFIIGPLLGGQLAHIDLRLPFLVAAAMSLLNWCYGFFLLPESLPVDRRQPLSWQRANPLGALLHLSRLRGAGGPIAVFALSMLAQWILQCTWVLYTTFRFGWHPNQNGFALFVVGVSAFVTQGVLLGRLIRRFGEPRLALLGLASSTLAFIGYGLATAGWVMYLLILANMLSFTIAPALQAIISRAADPRDQGFTQGSLSAIQSLCTVAAPLIGPPLLAQVSHLPAHDWRIGITFFVSAACQGLALVLAWRLFRRLPAAASRPQTASN
jgi:DHA1 family tetracycline resistance protein-like MFS transporter